MRWHAAVGPFSRDIDSHSAVAIASETFVQGELQHLPPTISLTSGYPNCLPCSVMLCCAPGVCCGPPSPGVVCEPVKTARDLWGPRIASIRALMNVCIVPSPSAGGGVCERGRGRVNALLDGLQIRATGEDGVLFDSCVMLCQCRGEMLWQGCVGRWGWAHLATLPDSVHCLCPTAMLFVDAATQLLPV
jgi:hypothetical protein